MQLQKKLCKELECYKFVRKVKNEIEPNLQLDKEIQGGTGEMKTELHSPEINNRLGTNRFLVLV